MATALKTSDDILCFKTFEFSLIPMSAPCDRHSKVRMLDDPRMSIMKPPVAQQGSIVQHHNSNSLWMKYRGTEVQIT
jgi:hypothetical protein